MHLLDGILLLAVCTFNRVSSFSRPFGVGNAGISRHVAWHSQSTGFAKEATKDSSVTIEGKNPDEEDTSFEMWKKYWLLNNLGDPISAPSSGYNPNATRAWQATGSNWRLTQDAAELALEGGDDKKKPGEGIQHTDAGEELDLASHAASVLEARGENDKDSAQLAYNEYSGKLSSSSPLSTATVAVLKEGAAEALLSWLRTSTFGNGLMLSDQGGLKTSDTAENRALWREHAPTVLKLVKEIGGDTTQHPRLQRIFTEAMMYQLSAKGIVKASLSGDALRFTSAVNVLVSKYPEDDNGASYIFLGAYYLAAPWPVGNPRKAKELFDKAVEVNGRSRRNVYYSGLARAALGQWKEAADAFRQAISEDKESGCFCASGGERDISGFLYEQASKGLEVALKRATE